MRVNEIIWLPEIEDKLWEKHRITVVEAEKVLSTWIAGSDRLMEEDRTSSISGSRSIEEMAEFWDTHSLADYEDQTYEVEMTFEPSARRSLVGIEPELMDELRRIARQRQISTQTLVNVWLQQRVDQASGAAIATH